MEREATAVAPEREASKGVQGLLGKVPQQVRVSFITKLKEFEVDTAPIQIDTKIEPVDLSKLVCQLLDKDENELALRFRIKDKLLRGSLKSHLAANLIFAEETLIVEYELSPLKPKAIRTQDQEDWIISVNGEKNNSYLLSLCNGAAKYYSKDGQLIGSAELPRTETVKCASIADVGARAYLASGCQSGNIYWRQISSTGLKAATSMCSLGGDAVEAMCANPLVFSVIAAGTATGKVHLIDSTKVQSKNVYFGKGTNSFKTDMRVVEPTGTGQVHSEAITCLRWVSGTRLITGSFDHNVKVSDGESFSETWSVFLKDLVPTALDFHPQSNHLLIGTEDGYIRNFDYRSQNKKAETLYKAHSKYVSSINFLPTDAHIFTSTSYDGLIKIWDIREELPLYTITSHKNKVFSSAWIGNEFLIAGGDDNKATVHQCGFNKASA